MKRSVIPRGVVQLTLSIIEPFRIIQPVIGVLELRASMRL